ncbi:uncharacterized protein PV09_03245 [Verruconis gallopava]|uniref:chitinase n=1 Tax=Verruconis gallopava TaxID=253628 RepID=A0A0D2B4C7_9PEZI|nr:uncharacterized protein PV09_03245 [Verruconis gallopava]KIW06074.1 hypothetical protein PV09_03245 [Verruconis gallopava]
MHRIRSLISTISLVPLVAAQTYTSCNPLKSTSCPADEGLSSSSLTSDFTSSSLPAKWNITAGSSLIDYGSGGTTFTIKESGDAPTIETEFYVFFGVISVFLKSAPGTGIVSSVVLESDDLDEIDWEWIGGDDSKVQTNYFGKGNTTTYNRELWVAAADCQTTAHNYTVNWQSDKTEWYVDGTLTRTLNYADAVDGTNYPQTPMRVKVGIWAGGDTSLNSEGTVEWAGGATNFSQGPFTMTLEKVVIVNQNPASSYTYGDESGSYTSIKIDGANSTTDTVSTARAAGNSTTSASNASGTAVASSASSSTAAITTTSAGSGFVVEGMAKALFACVLGAAAFLI